MLYCDGGRAVEAEVDVRGVSVATEARVSLSLMGPCGIVEDGRRTRAEARVRRLLSTRLVMPGRDEGSPLVEAEDGSMPRKLNALNDWDLGRSD